MSRRRSSLFLDPLVVQLKPNGRWTLMRSLRYQSAFLRGVIVVPEGFITDLASVPRLPLVFLVSGDSARAPAVVHDWLYRTQRLPRRHADRVFREAMGVGLDAEPAWRRWIMWAGVRLFGWTAWRANRRAARRGLA